MFFELKDLSKRYGSKTVLDGINFRVDRGDIVSIIGPSGSGKTTLLKIIAGIEQQSSGSVEFETRPSKGHPVILVFQDYLLFPNLSIYENVAFGLRARKVNKDEIEKRVNSFLSYFGIPEKSKNYPSQLSAGQQQRAAIARAMVVNPSVLLLDEPFANLDKTLKFETAEFIRATQKKFGITTISVTHDLEEAFAMSDKIGILLGGRLIQYDTVSEIYFNPASFKAAQFLGPVNTIPARFYPLFGLEGDNAPKTDQVYARAEAISLEKDDDGQGIVREVCFIGIMILYIIQIRDLAMKVYSLNDGLQVGDRVKLKLLKFFQ